jgi:transcription initiation factor TFIID subunit 5
MGSKRINQLMVLLHSNDQLGVFPTKNTPIYTVQFTKRNLCLAAGTRTPIVNDLLNDYITHPV